jgi:hypothetical protein
MEGQVPAKGTSKWTKVLLTTFLVAAVGGAGIGLVVWALRVPRGQDVDRITGFNQQSALLPPSQKDMGTVLAVNYHEYRTNSSWWSLAYYGCLFLSALLSATAALVLKLECFPKRPELKKDLSALFSTVAAVLITLSTVGNFQRKWQANRLAATAMQNLVYEVWQRGDGGKSNDDIYSRIEQTNLLRNQEVLGGDDFASQGQAKQSTAEPPPVKNKANDSVKAKEPAR